VRDRVDSIEHHVDTGLAAPEMLQFLAGWLGVELEPTDPPEYKRALVREVGPAARLARHPARHRGPARGGHRFPRHGARRGGIFGERDQIPPPDYKVVVQLDHTGHLSERQVQRFLEAELPLGSQVQLDIRFRREAVMTEYRAAGPPVSCPDCGAAVYPQRDQLCSQCGFPLMFLRERPGAGAQGFGVARAPGEQEEPAPAAHPVLLQPVPQAPQPAPNEIGCPACYEINPATRIRCQRCGIELRPARPAPLTLPPMPKAKRSKAWIAVLAAVLVVVALGTALTIWVLNRPESPTFRPALAVGSGAGAGAERGDHSDGHR
jgi:ribosomal protein L37E